MATPVHIILALTPEGVERYDSKKRIRDKSNRKHHPGISRHRANLTIKRLAERGFIPGEAELVEIRPEWMHRGRRQINSKFLLKLARERAEELSDRRTKVLIITDADMYATGSKYVVGQAEVDGRAAVVSIMRIKSGVQWRFLARLLKEMMHELGHTLGLGHCRNKECVMYPSKILPDSDIKSQNFCERCRIKVGRALRLE